MEVDLNCRNLSCVFGSGFVLSMNCFWVEFTSVVVKYFRGCHILCCCCLVLWACLKACFKNVSSTSKQNRPALFWDGGNFFFKRKCWGLPLLWVALKVLWPIAIYALFNKEYFVYCSLLKVLLDAHIAPHMLQYSSLLVHIYKKQ